MARIPPVDETSAPPASQDIAAAQLASGSRMTNMKWTLAHSPVALDALLTWYPLHDQVYRNRQVTPVEVMPVHPFRLVGRALQVTMHKTMTGLDGSNVARSHVPAAAIGVAAEAAAPPPAPAPAPAR